MLLYASSTHAQAASPSAAGRRIELLMSGNVSYDSNVAGGNTQVAQIRDVTPADVTYSVFANVDGNLPLGRQAAFFQASAAVRRHQKNSNLDGEDYRAGAGFKANLGTCGGQLSAEYTRQQTSPSQLIVLIPKNEVEGVSEAVTGTCVLGHFATTAAVQHSEVNNSAKSAGLRDSRNTSYSLGGGYAGQTLGTIQLSANYSETAYSQDNVVSSLLEGTGFHQAGIGLNYSRRIGFRLNGTASVSFNHVTPEGLAIGGQSFDSVSANAALNYRFSRKLQFSLQYLRDVHAADAIGANSATTESVNFGATYALSRRVNLSLGVADSKTRYHAVTTLPLALTDDEQKSVSGSVTFNVGKTISGTLDASYSKRDSNVALFNSDSAHVGFSVSKRF